MQTFRFARIAATLLAVLAAGACAGLEKREDTSEAAYIYGFPMIAAYKALYQFNVDTASSQYKAPFNTVWNDGQTFTPKDTAIPTPNADTPYSLLTLDLRAEPMVICVPAIEKSRYYSVQLADQYTFNFGYIGSRATGNDGGCYMVSGPGWTGAAPQGIAKSFASETQFVITIFRTQLFNPADIANVRAIQAKYRALPLSEFTGTAPPAAQPLPAFPAFTDDAFKLEFPRYLNFLLTLTDNPPEEAALRARFARIGIAPGLPFDSAGLSEADKLALGLGVKHGFEKIEARADAIGEDRNGWRVGAAFGNRAFYNGDFLLRAAAAKAGIFGNDAEEALYPLGVAASDGKKPDGHAHDYTITFPAGQLPPVNAFWSVTMYDADKQLLVANPLNRYLINSPMLPHLKKNRDGSLTIYVQHARPSADKVANWLPAPDGGIYMVMRLYWPKQAALDGTWKPPAIEVAR
jgi:hypothetical protein